METSKTLILSKSDVESLMKMKEAMKAVQNAFGSFTLGKTVMPSKIYINLPKYEGDFRAMPAYVEPTDSCSLKWVNVHPRNKKIHLPTVMAVLILSDPKTGYPLCIMDATYLTALRTGAAGGVAAKFLAKKKSNSVALVGCGVQAKTQLLALVELFSFKRIHVWEMNRKEADNFNRDLKKIKGLKKTVIQSFDLLKDCVFGCDIIVTTTPSRRALVKFDWLKAGCHINAIGADAKGKQELGLDIIQKAKVVVDAWDQASHSGEINVAVSRGFFPRRKLYAEIGEIVLGKKKGRLNDKEITVFDSTGLAIQDAAVAQVVYKKALKFKKGKNVKIV